MTTDSCYRIFNACFMHPFNLQIAGPTQSGKTSFICNLLQNLDNLLDKNMDYIVWFHGQATSAHPRMQHLLGDTLQIVEGIPTESFEPYINENRNGLFIFDDLSDATSKSSLMSDLICNKSHHPSISTICVLHNLFNHGKERKTLSRNCHYIVLMKNKLDMSIPYILANKLMPKNAKLFINIFEKATENPFGYLLVDGHPHSVPEAKFRTDIFNGYQKIFIVPNKLY